MFGTYSENVYLFPNKLCICYEFVGLLVQRSLKFSWRRLTARVARTAKNTQRIRKGSYPLNDVFHIVHRTSYTVHAVFISYFLFRICLRDFYMIIRLFVFNFLLLFLLLEGSVFFFNFNILDPYCVLIWNDPRPKVGGVGFGKLGSEVKNDR
jgi:hypothetical protein